MTPWVVDRHKAADVPGAGRPAARGCARDRAAKWRALTSVRVNKSCTRARSLPKSKPGGVISRGRRPLVACVAQRPVLSGSPV